MITKTIELTQTDLKIVRSLLSSAIIKAATKIENQLGPVEMLLVASGVLDDMISSIAEIEGAQIINISLNRGDPDDEDSIH